MNKFLELSILGIVVAGILVGCGTPETDMETEPKEEVKNNTAAAAEVEKKSWEDTNGNFGEWVSESVLILKEDLNDPKIKETNNDEGFEYYLKSEAIRDLRSSLNTNAKGEAIEKDLSNLFMLESFLSHEQFVRTAHIDPNGQAKEETEHFKQWKPTTENMRQANDYMKQLLHDLDVAINHDGKGETYGVSYILNGDKVSELENNQYWSSGE